ncbi:MAG: Rpn family recombination-promoting nuclease/putative transposase [Gammaproteobacteria bacterium]|nr:MAG: Rpn family recombination-promoting nuclease/putative transposase [Gammaproteobacteria bacterium]
MNRKTKTQQIVHAHDKFVRTAMSDLQVAREFFTMHLPHDIRQAMNLNHLVLQPRSQIDEMRKEVIVDLLYKTTIAEREAYLYLLVEHQSTPDELMAFRMLKYSCNIIDEHLKRTKKKTLPLIYPMVIYHGERPYSYSTDIKDLVDAPPELVERYFLQPFQLIDLAKIDDKELKQYAWAGVMEFALKHIYARDVLPHIIDIIDVLCYLDRSGGRSYVSLVLQYFLERGDIQDIETFFRLINEHISEEIGEKVMTGAERLIEKGIEKGKLEVAKQLLAKGIEMAFVAQVTGLPVTKIQEVQTILANHS